MRKKLSFNAWCYILAGLIAVGAPCYHAIAEEATVTTTKRANSGIKSTGDVKYQKVKADGTSETVTLFAVEDLYYLENRIVEVLNVKVAELQAAVK